MKFIVTGGRGFIGSHFVEEALKRNITIIDIDNMALNSAIWEKLTYQTILQMPAGKSLVCRITDYKLPFYMSNGIRKELSFYPNFNKYLYTVLIAFLLKDQPSLAPPSLETTEG